MKNKSKVNGIRSLKLFLARLAYRVLTELQDEATEAAIGILDNKNQCVNSVKLEKKEIEKNATNYFFLAILFKNMKFGLTKFIGAQGIAGFWNSFLKMNISEANQRMIGELDTLVSYFFDDEIIKSTSNNRKPTKSDLAMEISKLNTRYYYFLSNLPNNPHSKIIIDELRKKYHASLFSINVEYNLGILKYTLKDKQKKENLSLVIKNTLMALASRIIENDSLSALDKYQKAGDLLEEDISPLVEEVLESEVISEDLEDLVNEDSVVGQHWPSISKDLEDLVNEDN